MKMLKILIVAAILVAIGGVFLPQDYKVSREIVIQAPVTAIQKHVADMDNWVRWTVLEESVPPAGSIQPGQMQSGVGSGLYFSSNAGSGWYVISDDSDVDGFEYTVFSDNGDEEQGRIAFTDTGGETRVSWRVRGTVSKPPVLAPYIAMSKDFLLGSTINQSLKNLKRLVEQEDR